MALRLIVALAIILPLMFVVGFQSEWYVTFGIALLGFGAGHLVEALAKPGREDAGKNDT